MARVTSGSNCNARLATELSVVCSMAMSNDWRSSETTRSTVRLSEEYALMSDVEASDSCMWRDTVACCSRSWCRITRSWRANQYTPRVIPGMASNATSASLHSR